MGRRYRVGAFAALTGVSVRTLHHYDRIDLLRPSAHSEGGHRLYSEQDLLRLQQVLTLRRLGFSLARIGEIIERPDFDLVASMRIQRGALRDRISELERIEAALAELIDHRLATGHWAWELVAHASAAAQESLEQKGSKMDQYYTPEQMKQFEEIGEQVGPEAIKQIEQGWTALLTKVRANRELDPASPEAQELARRWSTLSAETAAAYRDYPDLWAAIGENYQKDRFADIEHAPRPEDFAFIQRANEAQAQAQADRENGGGTG